MNNKTKRFFSAVGKFARFPFEFLIFSRVNKAKNRFTLNVSDIKPCIFDNTPFTAFDRHYVFHTAWASRVLARHKPEFHVDISSSLYFVTSISAFINTKFYDYRPASLRLSGLETESIDLMSLSFASNSIQSLSCMHVVEHIGLGRYGDALDHDGDLTAINELKRVLAVNGRLLFVVPIGSRSHIQFNAHRVYTYSQILSIFKDFMLEEFALIPDNPSDGDLVFWPDDVMLARQNYSCGCFLFRK